MDREYLNARRDNFTQSGSTKINKKITTLDRENKN